MKDSCEGRVAILVPDRSLLLSPKAGMGVTMWAQPSQGTEEEDSVTLSPRNLPLQHP